MPSVTVSVHLVRVTRFWSEGLLASMLYALLERALALNVLPQVHEDQRVVVVLPRAVHLLGQACLRPLEISDELLRLLCLGRLEAGDVAPNLLPGRLREVRHRSKELLLLYQLHVSLCPLQAALVPEQPHLVVGPVLLADESLEAEDSLVGRLRRILLEASFVQ